MIDVAFIETLQKDNIIKWHTATFLENIAAPFDVIQLNNYWNFLLWHEEDIARIQHIEPALMVTVKRNIDKYNQARNNAMETIDEWILQQNIRPQASASLHSETPGMMTDRLSILHLKQYHTKEETLRTNVSREHIIKCEQRLHILEEQIHDLSNCLKDVLKKIEKGTLQFKVYRQLKMYNDPDLNPHLYKS